MNQNRAPTKSVHSPPRRWRTIAVALAFVPLGAHIARAQSAPPATHAPDATPALSVRLDAAVASVRVAGAHLSVVVLDAATGNVLYDHNAAEELNPASNAKLVTAAAALSLLGADRTYTTTLHGTLAGRTVRGGIVLRGGGDPSLRTGDLFEMARQLSGRGVDRIEGGVIVDDRAFGTEHLPPAFEQQPHESAPFRASVSAASVDENDLTLHVAAGASEGAAALVTLDPPGYAELSASVTTRAAGRADIVFDTTPGPSGREAAHVSGSFPLHADAATYRRRIDNPSLATGYALRAALEAAGIRVAGPVRVDPSAAARPTLASHESAPLSALLYELGKDSNNFYAEMTLLAIGASDHPPAVTFAHASDLVRAWVRSVGIDDTGMRLRNGSGLFDANRISPRQIAEVLRATWRDPAIRDEYIAQLAVAGDDGTLEHRIQVTGADRWVRAKTGTLDDVIALSGYVLSPDPGRTLVFSCITNGIHGHQAEARRLADRIARELVSEQQRTL